MKHVVFYSGGAGSYATTRRILDTPKYNVSKDDLHLVFTDTQIEDKGLYKFLIQTMSSIYGKTDQYNDLIELCDTIPEPYEGMDKRKAHLKQITELVSTEFPNFHWLRYELNNEAVSPWDIFYRQKFIGNSRVANCSTILKQRMARDFIKQNFKKEETKVYFGIDWSEEHRTKAPIENWSKYASEVIFPLCEEPYITKEDKWALLEREGIEKPDLYKLGFEHNNCFSGDTEFITKDGVFKLKDKVGQEVIVLSNGKSQWTKATVKSFGKQELWELKLKRGQQEDIIKTTANHRWYVKGKDHDIEMMVNTVDLIPGAIIPSITPNENLKKEDDWEVVSINPTGIIEEVYCAVVPETETFTLKNYQKTFNCGGFCVRAGQGHFKLLLETKPELFKYHEAMEQTLAEQIYEDIGDERTILNKTVKGVRYPLPLSKLRKIVHGEDTSETIDATEFGGCGCFVTDAELDAEDEVRFSVRDLKLIHKNKEI